MYGNQPEDTRYYATDNDSEGKQLDDTIEVIRVLHGVRDILAVLEDEV